MSTQNNEPLETQNSSMKYTTFGRNNGLRVSELALGTGNFGTAWGYGSEPKEAKAIFESYVKAGGNFIDTADGYQAGQSESLVGELIASDRDYFVLATKYTLGVNFNGGLSRTGNSRKNMIQSVEGSLKRLKTDRIDVLWAHFDDGVTPLEEILRAFDDLVRAGKIHYAGLSNFPAWRIARADTLSTLRGWSPLAGIQMEYSLVERSADRELIPMAKALGLAATFWSPLGGGLLTGKYRNGNKEGRLTGMGGAFIRVENTQRETDIVDTLLEIAKELEVVPSHVAIAWLLHKAKRSTTALIPILGARTPQQLEITLGAFRKPLSDNQAARLDVASEITLGEPYDAIKGSSSLIAGGQPELMQPSIIPAQ